PTAQGGSRCRRLRSARLSIVDDGVAVVLVPDLDSKLVYATPARLLTIQCGYHETIIAGPVDGARALVLGSVLRLGNDDHQPVVAGALESEAGGQELEVGVTLRNRVPLVVLGVEAEVRLAGQRGVRDVSLCRRGDRA